MSAAKRRDQFVWLGSDVRSDLTWWHKFLDTWKGMGILPTAGTPRLTLYTDASGSWGCNVCSEKEGSFCMAGLRC